MQADFDALEDIALRTGRALYEERKKRFRQFGPCPCGCNHPRRKNMRTASDACIDTELGGGE